MSAAILKLLIAFSTWVTIDYNLTDIPENCVGHPALDRLKYKAILIASHPPAIPRAGRIMAVADHFHCYDVDPGK